MGKTIKGKGKCQICNTYGILHKHHIIPRSLGGPDSLNNIIIICEKCHGKIHQKTMTNISTLVKKGLQDAKKNGKKLGRPRITIERLNKLWELRDAGYSIREIAEKLGLGKTTVSTQLRKGTKIDDDTYYLDEGE